MIDYTFEIFGSRNVCVLIHDIAITTFVTYYHDFYVEILLVDPAALFLSVSIA